VTNLPKLLKVKVVTYDEAGVTAAIQLPVLPERMDWEHDLIFKIGNRVIFGLFIHRYENDDIGVELFDAHDPEPVAVHKFTEA
jgi:hypothetical protein